jgi:hypothetical protein
MLWRQMASLRAQSSLTRQEQTTTYSLSLDLAAQSTLNNRTGIFTIIGAKRNS